MSTAITIADRRKEVMGYLRGLERTDFSRLLTDELKPARFVQVIGDALLREPRLLDCSTASIVQCARASAELGLELHSPLGHAYMVPMWNSRKGCLEATFIPGYRGLVKLMLESPRIAAVRAAVVYDGDDVDYQEGTDPHIHHVPRGKSDMMIAAYAVAHHVTGLAVPCWMWGREILLIEQEAIRKAKDRPTPWKGATRAEMWRKSPLRRLAKTMDLTDKMARALEHEAAIDAIGREPELPAGRTDDLKKRLASGEAEAADVVDGEIEDT